MMVANTVVSVTYDIAASIPNWGGAPGYGGITHDFSATQDWSDYQAFSFWFHGSGTGGDMRVELKADGTDPASSNRFEYTFADDVAGWRHFTIPFADFIKRTDYNPGAGLGDTLELSKMWGYSILLVPGTTGTFYLDEVSLFGQQPSEDFYTLILSLIFKNYEYVEPTNPCEVRETVVDDFEDGQLPYGLDGDGIDIGFFTWVGPNSTVAITTTLQTTNTVLQMDSNVTSWGGMTHHFENESVDTWTSQDWSTYEAISFWVYGNNTGSNLFFEVQDNRNPGSTADDTEIWSYPFVDNFTGWKRFDVMFDDFNRKEIGNGAPNDGFGRFEVHGWAFGSTDFVGTNYIDNVTICGIQDNNQDLQVAFSQKDFNVTEGDAVSITVKLNETSTESVTVNYTTEPSQAGNAAKAYRDYVPTRGQLVFAPGETEKTFTVETIDDLKYKSESGTRLVLSNPQNAALGTLDRARLLITDDDSTDPAMVDDFEVYPYFFDTWSNVSLSSLELTTDPVIDDFENGLPETDESVPPPYGWIPFGGTIAANLISVPASWQNPTQAVSITFNIAGFGGISRIFEAESQDWSSFEGIRFWVYGTNSGSNVNFQIFDNRGNPGTDSSERWIVAPAFTDDAVGWKQVTLPFSSFVRNGWQPGGAPDDGLTLDDIWGYAIDIPDAQVGTFYFDQLEGYNNSVAPLTGQGTYEKVLGVDFGALNAIGKGFGKTFAQSQDWSSYGELSFWYYGSNTGETVTVELQDNRAPDPGPTGWELVWSDEFDGAAGDSPDAFTWTHEIGNGFDQGITGWGNGEYQYYTDSTENSALDGAGTLVITATQVDTNTTQLDCWYGLCDYTSARLITDQKFEVAYGRVEARIQVPYGNGMWPAFWMLGSNIGEVGWPQSGEIDIMEHIGKEPQEVYGTIHGPGYSGGNGVGGSTTLTDNVSDAYHVFAIEWEPEVIRWYVDNTNYFTASIDDIPAGTEWVYDHPFFIILNVAVGGNWPGDPDETTVFPQTMKVDYVRVYQAADTAERFQATFTDNFTGWQKVNIQMSEFTRRTVQPVAAPNDGLTLTEVWGYGFDLSGTQNTPFYLDQTHLELTP